MDSGRPVEDRACERNGLLTEGVAKVLFGIGVPQRAEFSAGDGLGKPLDATVADNRAYVFAVLEATRKVLRRCDIFVAASARFADPNRGMLEDAAWASARPPQRVGRPKGRLDTRSAVVPFLRPPSRTSGLPVPCRTDPGAEPFADVEHRCAQMWMRSISSSEISSDRRL